MVYRKLLKLFLILFPILLIGAGILFFAFNQPQMTGNYATINSGDFSGTSGSTDAEDTLISKQRQNPDREKVSGQNDFHQELLSGTNHELTSAGWVPSWGSETGLASIQRNNFTYVSPVWYSVNDDGSLKSHYPDNKNAITAAVTASSSQLIPTVGMFDAELFSTVLNDEIYFNRHIDSIVNQVLTNNYAGIDLDYEATYFKDKKLYEQFIVNLAEQLQENNKLLIITVLAKWGDNINYSYRPETRAVQDWEFLSELADQIRIMAYDYTSPSSINPGPIGPTGWIESILSYAKNKIPPDKTILGIHLYAYEWYSLSFSENNEGGMIFEPDTDNNPANSPRTARAYTYYNVNSILLENTENTLLDEFQGEKIFRYRAEIEPGRFEDRMLVYIDKYGVTERLDLAKDYKIAGVVFWRLGNEMNILDNL